MSCTVGPDPKETNFSTRPKRTKYDNRQDTNHQSGVHEEKKKNFGST